MVHSLTRELKNWCFLCSQPEECSSCPEQVRSVPYSVQWILQAEFLALIHCSIMQGNQVVMRGKPGEIKVSTAMYSRNVSCNDRLDELNAHAKVVYMQHAKRITRSKFDSSTHARRQDSGKLIENYPHKT